jgi:hypothetical protein
VALPTVRPGDVFRLWIRGRNGDVKRRVCVVVDGHPSPHAPRVVLFIFGCSNTKGNATPEDYVRVEATNAVRFNALRLDNGTTFHADDIGLFDAHSASLRQRISACPTSLLIELRQLVQRRLLTVESIDLYPEQASDEAEHAAGAFLDATKKAAGPERP